jgi:hydroxymethylpyrimidine/phosphomethylpyrimidine kinase
VAERKKKAGPKKARPKLEFNHAMIYTKRLDEALVFYRDLLGFAVVDEYPGVYVRLRAPSGGGTIALHLLEKGKKMVPRSEGLRLYFEVKGLDAFCRTLARKGIRFDQMPKRMPWGWSHAYLEDPDGHELSLYWAGKARLRRTTMD